MTTDTTTETTAQPTTATITLQCPFCFAWNRIAAARATQGPKCGKCATPIRLDRPFKLIDDTFDRTITESTVPVLVDFYADWCGPCKMMAPFVDELAHEWQGRALVAKLDTDASARTAAAQRITGMPTTIVYRGGKEVARQVGAVNKARLEQLLGS